MIDTVVHIAPFNVRIRSPFAALGRHLDTFYASDERGRPGAFIDFDIQVLRGKAARRWWRPQARFLLDGDEPFFPLPADQSAPLFEWGLNWCVASRPLGYLVMHAAVLARSSGALMLPGFPGAGKSTLCASLCLLEGWRLLSDELALLDPATGMLHPHPRPISLKNASIRLVSTFPQAYVGPVYRSTRKGDISHAACPSASVAAAAETAGVRWVVFPRFEAGSAPRCDEISRVEAFALISEQSFNNERMGEAGFDALCHLLSGARCFQVGYGSTADGLRLLDKIAGA